MAQGKFAARNICFTINNPTTELSMGISDVVRYAVWQKERGESGTLHYQGYIEFTKVMYMKGIKAILGDSAHIEGRKGTRDQARAYCMKDDTRLEGPWEYGTWENGQGRRTDLEAVTDLIKEKKPMKDIATEFPVQFVKFHKGFERLNSLINMEERNPDNPPRVEWIYGPTGTGKTRYATTEYGSCYYIKDHTQWWDGYTQQPVIIIDDFDGRWPYRDLLRLLDRYPYQGQYKGGYIHVNSPYIIITADRKPEDVYANLDKHEISQLMRRINFLKFLGNRGLETEVAGNTKPPQTEVDDF